MIDFIEYVVRELKSKRLTRSHALALIKQFSRPAPLANGCVLHPLLHCNTSDLSQQSYRSTFSGEEFFLRDHQIQGKKVLPAVAYLEMARAAVAQALPERGSAVELRNIAWAQPIVADGRTDVMLALFASEESSGAHDQVEVEIHGAEDVVNFQAQAVLAGASASSRRDLDQLREQMTKGSVDAARLYTTISGVGIDLGPAHRGVSVIHQGEQQLLATIRRPDVVDETHDQYVLHPSVMDSALQAAMSLIIGSTTGAPPIPFALESLRIFGGVGKDMIAWVRYSAGGKRDDKVIKLDIDLCDEEGNVRVQMLGFSSRVLSADLNQPKARKETTGCLLAQHVWQEMPALAVTDAAAFADKHVVLCDLTSVDAVRLDDQCLEVRTRTGASLADRYTDAALSCFERVQTILKSKPQGRVLLQVVAPNDADGLLLAGLSGMLKTAAQENPKLVGQIIFTERNTSTGELIPQLREAARTSEQLIKHEGGKRKVVRWQEVPSSQAPGKLAFKEHGVYLITGGLGGLGVLFAKEILAQAAGAKVILTGRSPLTPDKQAKLAEFGAEGRAFYRELDLADLDQVRHVIASVVGEFGQLNGIIHSAGMVADNFIFKKTAEELRAVFAPKVTGTFNLDQASSATDLDFLTLFSSGVAAFGNAGQADYAAANGFLDEFATHRNRLVAANARRGLTVSLNWPLWQEGGMRVDGANREMLQRSAGMHPMRTAIGIQAFHRSLELRQSPVLVVEGDLELMRRALLNDVTVQPEAKPAPSQVNSGDWLEKTEDYLRRQFSTVLKLAVHRIDPRAPLEKYGIDSILAMDLTSQLERSFGSLPKTLFFEYQTIRELSSYLVRDHAAKLASVLDSRTHVAVAAESRASADQRSAVAVKARTSKRFMRRGAAAPALSSDPIAIVGLSGRYPDAIDVEEYWRNLREGRDCIVEVPRQRWDWREYFSEDRTAAGRHYSKWGGFISGVDEFDPLFFNIPPVDAELIDPQERLFLQHAWMAVEDAGYTRASLRAPHADGMPGQVGVYVGVMYGEYQIFGAEASLQGKRMGVPVSYASIANRVSYVFNLHGPSMTLDTMCSSSLTAIHLACQDLKLGRTHLAIAGGVNVTIHPNKYLILSAGQFISSDGHCQSFGAGGDGYIPGEGVGVVVLKRLSEAQRDGNHIYGVIKGSALNHGGKTNGYSVPNPQAQANVIAQAFQEHGVNARHVSYIEAHGTGTKLGDPIEIAALTQVFRQHTPESQFCAIGSAKSNIGHCESAAGIAGLTKVLLQMKHQQIAPSLHSATLNPHVNFEKSPFVVNQTLRHWEQPEVDGRRWPRLAGISSFGAGGSNAHLIVEEYSSPQREFDGPGAQVIIALSARTEQQLKQKARELLAFIRTHERAIDLASMAYTLQVGREPMALRLSLLVDSIGQLADKLAAYDRDELSIDQCSHGQVGQDVDGMSLLNQDEDMLEAIDKWIARGKFSKLADLWVKGLELDWRKLYGERKPALMSLPTYPFAKDRYWAGRHVDRNVSSRTGAAALHPLLHTNTSDFYQQSYASVFTGQELFLADHQVVIDGATRRMLPAVAYLEMVRAAVELALPSRDEARSLELKNVAWAQPLTVEKEAKVAVVLLSNGENAIDFEVRGRGEPAAEIVHCQGRAEISAVAASSVLDVQSLKARMSRGTLSPQKIYDAFRSMGIHYGPGFQALAGIQRGHDELIAELVLPSAAGIESGRYLLHPSLLDSALQAALGLIADLDDLPRSPAIPFALDSLRIRTPCAPRMFAWVRHAPGGQASREITKVDIDLCDCDGRICAQLSGLTSRALTVADAKIGSLLAQPVWEAITVDSEAVSYQRHHVFLCNVSVDAVQLEASMPGVNVEHCDVSGATGIAARYRAVALACFERLRTIAQAKPTGGYLFQVVVGHAGESALFAGLSGLIRTARLENPQFAGQVVLTSNNVDAATLAVQLRASRALPGEALIKYEGATRSVLRWQSQAVQAASTPSFKDRGVYLITGGLGGLGMLFAQEIFARTQGATVIFTGRAAADETKQAVLNRIATDCGVSPHQLAYRQLDLTQLAHVAAMVSDVASKFGRIDGVLHSAGMIRDGLIVNKTAAEFSDVLAPKVDGVVHLDLATRELDLDFLVLFSSVAAATGNVGQADYATANAFMDGFASHRNYLVSTGARRGRTLSINWPLWDAGGMQLDADARDMLRRASGMVPLQTSTGMAAFHQSMSLPAGQVLVVEGHLEQLLQALSGRGTSPQSEAASRSDAAVTVDGGKLLEKAHGYLSQQFASLLQIPAHEVDPKAPLEKYGIDSVLAMKFTNQLERTFGSLSKTLLFEYQTLASLARYLVTAFPAILRQQTGVPADTQTKMTAPVAAARHALVPMKRGSSRLIGPAVQANDDVAIIGVSGKYPQASNLTEFWDNLKNGRDCITEVPPDRWDHSRFFHPSRHQAGKTYSKWGGFLGGVDQFDALFFNISPKEAELIDPQERLFLETVWETIEDAGYSKDGIAANRVGVFVGVMWGQYELFGAASAQAGVPSSSFASIANRVSYFFDFHGPSLALDTMCSSSLTAIHLASEEVRKGAVDVAVAGGVNVSIHPNKYLSLSQGSFASTDGRCRSFGQGGDGYVPGEGVGAVLLKPLAKALEDGDQVYAIIKASSINHGGKTNGYTVPNPVAQSQLIVETLGKANIDPATLSYIEAHGTGTSLGDPIEVTGLLKAFEGGSARQQRCPIGSVKSNIGHLESAAGIAAITKVLLQLKHRQLVPSLHAQPANPHLDLESTPFYVQTTLQDWQRHDNRPHRVGVSSFGAGGSNAHVILEEFVDARSLVAAPARPEAFVLSARNRESLLAYVRKVNQFLEQDTESSLAEIAFTSQVGRTPMAERLVVIAASKAALREKLAQWLQEPRVAIEDLHEGNTRSASSNTGALIEGEAGAAFLRLTLQHRDLAKLAKLWISGVEIEWALLHAPASVKRVSLPTYPFQKERYWINADLPLPAATSSATDPGQQKQLLYYRPAWRASDVVRGTDNQSAPVLIMDATDELCVEFRRQRPGPAVVLVKPGESYRQLGEYTFSANVAEEQDFVQLIGGLKARNLLPGAIVHRCPGDEQVSHCLDRGVFALHHLCKALMKQKPKDAIRIVSLGEERERQAPLHSALGGYFKTLVLENPKLVGKAVSLPASIPIEATVQRLVDELFDCNSGDREVSYRSVSDGSTRRLIRALERYMPAVARQSAVKQQGVYLITGGLGGLGFIFAEHLIRNYHAKLVLLGRSTPGGEQQRRLDDLRGYGDDVLYLQADVCNREQVETAIREVKRRFARIDGVIHSAGVHRDSFVMNKTSDEMQTVFAAKVMGAINLDLATRAESLDMFVLFSSVAGVLGNAGQSDYAFANSFLDAFAQQREAQVQSGQRSGRTLSIDWPFWQAGGMTLSAGDIELVEQRAGISPLPTKSGIECWETLLQTDVAQGVVLYGEPSKVDAYVLGQPTQAAVRDASPTLDLGTLVAETQRYLAALLSEQIKLPVDRIDPQERFESFGVDSMMVARINAQLERDLGELSKTLFYEYATIEELAAYLAQEARPRLAQMFGTSAAAAALHGEPSQPSKDEARPQERQVAQQNFAAEPIAIIGVHGYFPRSDTLAEYWDHLKNGRDLIGDVPANRWHWQDFFDANPDQAKDGRIYCKSGGFLADFDKFDASFFGIPAADARLIDPQERLFLQSVWAAIEDAGYTRQSLQQRHPKAKSADVGVFGGVTTNSYHLLTTDEWNRGNMVTPGAMPWSIVNRVSYVFDFQGPSMPVDTACSSSLVAIHLACESLKRGECQVAIAGGVNLYLHPSKYQSLCRRRMLAVEGKCRSFGAGDDGFIPGEGVGTLVLKPLSQARADGDHIHGVIAASAYEHSGRSNGYSAPNPNSQAQLIDETLRKANIHPDTIGYVEGHGTGTQLGDSLEIVSLTQAFRRQTQRTEFCPVGSVKANVGHSESAAGIAGVAKILLQFKHQKIAPTIHSRNVNPNIDFASSPFYLQHELTEWKAPEGYPRRAMINSFGAGGVNACLILEEHGQPRVDRGSDSKRPHLIVLSAKSMPRLRESAERLKDYLLTEASVDLTALAYTLQVGREAMDERLTVMAASADDLLDRLNLFLANTPCPQVAQGRIEARRKRKSLAQPERASIKSEYLSGELGGLAQRWLEGQGIDWNDFHEGARPCKLPLPTYPFAKDRHWVSDALVAEKRVTATQQPAQLHPLVTNNVSTLRETCFASSLTDEQYYARDHRVNGEMFFPGAGLLEIACASGAIAGEQAVSSIRDIVWIQPLRFAGGSTLIKTFLEANGNSTDYAIVSFNEDNERVVHSEGRLLHGTDRKPGNDVIAIADLKQRGGKSLQGAMCYREFEKFGFRYGPAFRTIQELYVGSNFALSKLQLAAELSHDFEQYILHPCLIDGALQTVIGIAGEAESDTPYLPFALDAVEILRPLPETCYAYVELATSEHSSRPDIKQFNIRLLSEAGDVLVKLNNFHVRALVTPPAGRHGHASSVLVSEQSPR